MLKYNIASVIFCCALNTVWITPVHAEDDEKKLAKDFKESVDYVVEGANSLKEFCKVKVAYPAKAAEAAEAAKAAEAALKAAKKAAKKAEATEKTDVAAKKSRKAEAAKAAEAAEAAKIVATQKAKEAKEAEDSSEAGDAKMKMGKFCTNFCENENENEQGKYLGICRLTNSSAAAAALLADRESVTKVIEYLPKRMGELSLERLDKTASVDSPVYEQRSLVPVIPGSDAVASAITKFAYQGIVALGKVIQDRARREAIGWVLDEMVRELCEYNGNTFPAANEIEDYWAPNLCKLATEERAGGYGAGAMMLDSLRGSIRSDLEGMPGAAIGVLLGAVFWEDAKIDLEKAISAKSLFVCAHHSDKEECKKLKELRKETIFTFSNILKGSNASIELYNFSKQLNDINLLEIVDKDNALYSPKTQLLACAISIPKVASEIQPYLAKLDMGDGAKAAIGVTAGIARSPACWTMFGKGFNKKNVKEFLEKSGDKALGDLENAINNPNIERFSQSVQLLDTVLKHGYSLRDSAASLKSAVDTLHSAWSTKINMKSKDIKAEMARKTIVRALATLELLESAINFADSSTLVIKELAVNGTDYFPGLVDKKGEEIIKATNSKEKTKEIFADISERLVDARDIVGAMKLLANQNWTEGISQLSSTSIDLLAYACKAKDDVNKCNQYYDKLVRYTGLMTSLITAKDSEEMAGIIDEAANPPGGWRRKNNKAVTISFTAHAGFGGGIEKRYGQYGVKNYPTEHPFQKVDAQLPALMMPFGIEIAIGTGNWHHGPFIPLIDPAAFLAYDENGRIPGARLTTVLSPGIGWVLSLARSPFAIMPLIVFRPKFRTWEPTINEPGANVFQFLVLVSVDVTLFKISSKARENKKTNGGNYDKH